MGEGAQYGSFGDYLRAQRQLAHLSLRQLADLTKVSNPYLSQLERGLHQPSVGVLKSLAQALNVSFDILLAQVTGSSDAGDKGGNGAMSTEAAIRNDPRLSDSQKAARTFATRAMKRSRRRPRTAEITGEKKRTPKTLSPHNDVPRNWVMAMSGGLL